MERSDALDVPVVTLPFGAWFGDERRTFAFPPGWRLLRADMAGAPAMDDARVAEALARPRGSARLEELAKGKRTAAIAVDDISRPTPAYRFLPRMIDALRRGGIRDEDVRLIIGSGSHRPMDRHEIELKVGRDIASRFPILMHDFAGRDNAFLGWVAGGPVYVNRHFLQADLKIVAGVVSPHRETGFGGGAKMIVPGLAGHRTIAHFHGALPERKLGRLEASGGRLDRRAWSELVARHVRVDAAVCCVVNADRELAGLVAGDVVEAHREAARQALAAGRTAVSRIEAARADVVVINSFPFDTDPVQLGKFMALGEGFNPRFTIGITAGSDGVFYHGLGIGVGVQLVRLARNLPGWLLNPRAIGSWARSMLKALPAPRLMARLCFFSLNALPYGRFERGEGRRPLDEPAAWQGPPLADPLICSERFPAWGFKRSYPSGRLFRTWEELSASLAARLPVARAIVFPCAPLQLVELVG